MYNMVDLAWTPLQNHGTFKRNASMLDEIWVVNCSAGLIGKLHLGKQVRISPTELPKAYNAYYFGMSTQIYLVNLPTRNPRSFSSNSVFVHSLFLSNNSTYRYQPNLCQHFFRACSTCRTIECI